MADGTERQELQTKTVEALRNAQSGLNEFKSRFQQCSDTFDSGDDNGALQIFRDMLDGLREFSAFCSALMENCPYYASQEECEKLNSKCERLHRLMENIVNHSEKQNFTEVSDILRYDMSELMDEFGTLFPDLADAVEAHKEDQ